ncbi:alpha-mannosidase [Bacillus sp. JCM 19046]|nr:alpha-mannosidase [Bacillus sp. JCM 19046]
MRQGYELNHPITLAFAKETHGKRKSTHRFVAVEATHTILDTVKPSEDGDGFIMRVYESSGSREAMDITLEDVSVSTVYETNLLEEAGSSLSIEKQTISTTLTPFEVKTIKVLKDER